MWLVAFIVGMGVFLWRSLVFAGDLDEGALWFALPWLFAGAIACLLSLVVGLVWVIAGPARRRWGAGAAVFALIVATQLSLVAAFPVKGGWTEGCNEHAGWRPLAALLFGAADESSRLRIAYLDEEGLACVSRARSTVLRLGQSQ